MADKRIDQLTAATSLGDSDLLVVEQSSTAKKATGTVVSNYINSKFGLSGMASDISTLQTTVAGKQDALTLPLPISQGGTNATTVGSARASLGLGTAATANIDTTLSIQGGAADAKATGDAINKLKDSYPVSYFTRTTTASGATYEKIDDSHLKLYGTATSTGLRSLSLLNGVVQVLTSASTPIWNFPAGTYKFNVEFTGSNTENWLLIKPNSTSGNIRIYNGDVISVDTSFTVIIRVPANTNWGTESDPTYLFFKAEALGAQAPYVLVATGDNTDRTDDISSCLRAYGKCVLSAGEFYAAAIDMPQNSSLEGFGAESKLILPTSATGALVNVSTGCTVKDLALIGGEEVAIDTIGTRIGINHAIADAVKITISGCRIVGFDLAGIYCSETGQASLSSTISDCFVMFCYYGIYTTNSEYLCVSNCQFNQNYFGAMNRGGNNKFANCGFDKNVTNYQIDEDDGAHNGGHGSMVGCSFNHSNLASNDGYAIIIRSTGRELFSGCSIGSGTILLDTTNGNIFAGCNFGSNVPIEITNGACSLFSGCIFRSEADSPVTRTNNTTTVFANCYTRAGAVFNPT
jgi:hypothetical protein